mmetsp:Transcript_35410/g.74337  ORF Transcript_35410/g.74337 Transcript_35410/m.74337 type:complete len:529 (+) Transcript_35410:233-1819(+)
MKRTVSALRPKAALVIDPFCTVCEAAKKCSKAHVDAVLICDDGKLMGILTDTDVLARVIAKGLDPKEVKVCDVMTREPTCVRSGEDAVEALCTMVSHAFRHLPVLDDNGRIIGVLDITKCLYDAIARLERYVSDASASLSRSVLAALPQTHAHTQAHAQQAHARQMLDALVSKLFAPPIAQVLSSRDGADRHAFSLRGDESVQAAAVLMAARQGAVLVGAAAEDDAHACAGIVTSRDVLHRVVAKGLDATRTRVDTIMTTEPDCMEEEATVLQALHQMQYGGYRHVPVLNTAREPTGVLDVLALVEAALSQLKAPAAADSTECWRDFWGSAESIVDVAPYGPPSSGPRSESAPSATRSTDGNGARQLEGSCQSLQSSCQTSDASAKLFLFKLKTSAGQMHRLHHSAESLASLRAAAAAQLGIDDGNANRLVLEYDDEEGDRVLVSTDAQLREAVSLAQRAEKNRLVLHATTGCASENAPAQAPVREDARSLDGNVQKNMSAQERTFLLGSAVALGAIIATVGGSISRR